MRGFVINTVVTAIAFAAMAYILKPNIQYQGDIPALLLLAVIAGVVNGLIKPIIKLLSLPIRLATLGLFTFVINAAMLLLIAWLADKVDIHFTIHGFPPDFTLDAFIWALIGSIVLSVISTIIGFFIHD
jgi:putative membrane protein